MDMVIVAVLVGVFLAGASAYGESLDQAAASKAVLSDSTEAVELMRTTAEEEIGLRDSLAANESVSQRLQVENARKLDSLIMVVSSLDFAFRRADLETGKQLESLVRTIDSSQDTLGSMILGVEARIDSLEGSATSARQRAYTFLTILLVLTTLAVAFSIWLGYRTASVRAQYLRQFDESVSYLQNAIAGLPEHAPAVGRDLSPSTSELHVQHNGTDYSLGISLGEELYRMRLRVLSMDETTKGVTALSNSLSRLEDSFNKAGYLLKDYSGKPYVAEMTYIVKHWEPLDSIAAGQKIILRMIKPQVLYRSEVISPGEVVVGISVSDSVFATGGKSSDSVQD
jgi:hypothetical protein